MIICHVMKTDVFHSNLLKVGEAGDHLTAPLCTLVGDWEMSSDFSNSQKQVWWLTPMIPALGGRGERQAAGV